MATGATSNTRNHKAGEMGPTAIGSRPGDAGSGSPVRVFGSSRMTVCGYRRRISLRRTTTSRSFSVVVWRAGSPSGLAGSHRCTGVMSGRMVGSSASRTRCQIVRIGMAPRTSGTPRQTSSDAACWESPTRNDSMNTPLVRNVTTPFGGISPARGSSHSGARSRSHAQAGRSRSGSMTYGTSNRAGVGRMRPATASTIEPRGSNARSRAATTAAMSTGSHGRSACHSGSRMPEMLTSKGDPPNSMDAADPPSASARCSTDSGLASPTPSSDQAGGSGASCGTRHSFARTSASPGPVGAGSPGTSRRPRRAMCRRAAADSRPGLRGLRSPAIFVSALAPSSARTLRNAGP